MNNRLYIVIFPLILTINSSKCMDTEYKRKIAETKTTIENINATSISFADSCKLIGHLKEFLASKTPEKRKHNNALFKAVKDADYSTLTALLADNGDPNVYNEKNVPLIMQALFKKDLTSLAIILSAPGVNPNIERKPHKGKGFTYYTPLSYSIANSLLGATILLCNAGSNKGLPEWQRPSWGTFSNDCAKYYYLRS